MYFLECHCELPDNNIGASLFEGLSEECKRLERAVRCVFKDKMICHLLIGKRLGSFVDPVAFDNLFHVT